MRILALDCATQACSVALMVDGQCLAHIYEERARGHAERLLPMAGEALSHTGADYAAIDVFAVTIGPGTYTGVRIGLATARALALAADRPLIGITTTAAVAHAAMASPAPPGAGTVLVVALETKRADLYLQCFAPSRPQLAPAPLSPPASLPPDEIAEALPAGDLVVAGDGGARLADLLGSARQVGSARQAGAARPVTLWPGADYPDARHVATLAALHLGGRPPAAKPPPPRALYLRPPDVTLPRPRP